MSIARIYTTQKSRKVWTCGKCRQEIPKGEKVLHFAVGFRGYEQHRCGKPECFPKPSERESSLVSSVFAAQENVDLENCFTLEDLNDALQEVVDAINEVADEYEQNEMFDINENLQERVDTLRASADDLETWNSSLEEEPLDDEDRFRTTECEGCGGTGKDDKGESCFDCGGTGEAEPDEDFESVHEEWLNTARGEAEEAISSIELP